MATDILNEDDAPRIGRFEQSAVVHAKCDNPDLDFQDVIGIEFGQCQSTFMKKIQLGADITFGAIELNIEGNPYEFSLASARVRLEQDNADVHSGSRYKHVLSEGRVEATFSEKDKKNVSSSLGANLSLDTNEKPKVGISAILSRKGNKESETTQLVQHEIPLVLPTGQGLWQLGGPGGDPRRRERDLRGAIVSSYLNDELTPLCILAARDPSLPVTARVSVEASPTDFRLRSKVQQNPHRSAPNAAFDSIREGMADDKKKYLSRAKEAEDSLKERVAALALFEFSRAGARESMMSLAERRFVVSPLPKDDVGEGQ